MFSQELYTQYFIFLKSLGVGLLNGVIYFILSRLGNNNRFLKAFFDITFFVTFSIISFVFVFDSNFGVARAYIFSGEIIGCVCSVILLKNIISKRK